MAKTRWPSCVLAVALALGMACAQRASAFDEDIPPLLTKEKVGVYNLLISPMVDFTPPPISFIPRDHPFKAIGLEVQGGLAVEELAKFARRAVEARLEELGVAGQIQVIHPPNPGTESRVPDGVLPCEVLRVTFVINGTGQGAEGKGVIAIAADLLATQQSSCAADDPQSTRAVQAGPRVVMAPWQHEQATMEQSRKLILDFIDADIVLKVLSSNKTAAETLRSALPKAN